jgi:hypothetical protein
VVAPGCASRRPPAALESQYRAEVIRTDTDTGRVLTYHLTPARTWIVDSIRPPAAASPGTPAAEVPRVVWRGGPTDEERRRFGAFLRTFPVDPEVLAGTPGDVDDPVTTRFVFRLPGRMRDFSLHRSHQPDLARFADEVSALVPERYRFAIRSAPAVRDAPIAP